VTPSVLVVDDSPTIRGFARLFLRSLKVDVLEAEDGERALAIVREKRPSVIVVDVNMPQMDGLTFTRALRADGDADVRSIPVLLLTGEKSDDLRARGTEAGADELIEKPIKGPALQDAVKRWLGGRK
jgi:two-component system, chemotaxis family, chemotaxis protein CheY